MTAEPIYEPEDAGPPDWHDDPEKVADVEAYLRPVSTEAPHIAIETWAEFSAKAAAETAEEAARVEQADAEALADFGELPLDRVDPRDLFAPPAPGTFPDRVTSRRVDLVQRIREGIPPADYLPASDGMLRRGKRHQKVAPKKVGKSIATLVHIVDMALAGAHIVVFDRENGGNLYADRLDQIMEARGLDVEAQAEIAARLGYYEFPRFRNTDETELVELCTGADLVVFDSQRMFLSDLGLEEDGNDDYTEFMAALVDPLFRAGIATLILDNRGHQAPKRSRGASAKRDLNEILFALETVERFNIHTTGRLRLEITDSRFGNSGRWELEIGGGVFGSWRRIDEPDADAPAGFRPTALMERASIFVESCIEKPSRRTVTDEIGGKGRYARIAIECLVREGYMRGAKGEGLEVIKPYRQADDPLAEEGRNE